MRRSRDGFTLVEVLVALALFATIGVFVANALRSGALAWRVDSKAIERLNSSRTTFHALARVIEHAKPIAVRASGKQRLLLDGAEERLRFSGAMPHNISEQPLYVFELRVANDTDTLALYYWPLTDINAGILEQPSSDWDMVSINNGANAVHFEYFGNTDEDEPKQWRSRWSHDTRQPELIKIRIESADRATPSQTYVFALTARFNQKSPTHVLRVRHH